MRPYCFSLRWPGIRLFYYTIFVADLENFRRIFFSPLSFSLFRALLLSRVSCYIIVLLPSNYYAPLGELRSFPIPLWLDKQARFLNASLVSRGSLSRLAFEIRSSPLERWNLVYFSIGEFRISSLESQI